MFEFDYKEALYRRNNFGQPCIWCAKTLGMRSYIVYHGILGKSITYQIIHTHRDSSDEIQSKIKDKRKIGYKYLSEIRDDNVIPPVEELIDYLVTYLPTIRTTADGTMLPMLAKSYDNNVFKKTTTYLGQWKINGLRCFISAHNVVGNMFKPIELRFQSREGTYWKTLGNLEEYLLEVIPYKFLNKMVDEHIILDGEIYLPGYSINQINHFVKNDRCKENSLLQFWCYDLAIEDTIQLERNEIRINEFLNFNLHIDNRGDHLRNKNKLVILPTYVIRNAPEACNHRDLFINMGFEGLILRNPDVEYQFGKRNSSMIKYKSHTDGKFKIIDIYPEGVKRPDIPLFKCKNDINDCCFECHVGGPIDTQKAILKLKDNYIGKYMFVEFGERSGIDNVPFHIKNTYIINE